jgi:hypothetical protein
MQNHDPLARWLSERRLTFCRNLKLNLKFLQKVVPLSLMHKFKDLCRNLQKQRVVGSSARGTEIEAERPSVV